MFSCLSISLFPSIFTCILFIFIPSEQAFICYKKKLFKFYFLSEDLVSPGKECVVKDLEWDLVILVTLFPL